MNKIRVKAFQSQVWAWYRHHAPQLSWRETANPYHILLSEVMLQQTQISRVVQKYPQFLHAFPTLKRLAHSSLGGILKEWQGMGYNRRALYLKKIAEHITKEYRGKVPRGVEELDALPGIGPYSARAIACFAYKACEPFIETNIRRAIIHGFFPRKNQVSDQDILKILTLIQPTRKTWEWYWALMDYGREGLKGTPNANRRSKHYARQSKFEGSTRQVRSEVLRHILEKKKTTSGEIRLSLKKKISHREFGKILQSLHKEGLITLEKDSILIR